MSDLKYPDDRLSVFREANGRECVVLFQGFDNDGAGYSTIRNEAGQVRVGYLAADGTEPVPFAASGEFGWIYPWRLYRVRSLSDREVTR